MPIGEVDKKVCFVERSTKQGLINTIYNLYYLANIIK